MLDLRLTVAGLSLTVGTLVLASSQTKGGIDFQGHHPTKTKFQPCLQSAQKVSLKMLN